MELSKNIPAGPLDANYFHQGKIHAIYHNNLSKNSSLRGKYSTHPQTNLI